MLFFFFCCFWAYCRPLLLLLISFCCFWTCCRALIASFYCWILLLLFIVAPPQSHLQLTILTMIIKCGIIKLAHKYKWKLRSVSLKISAFFYCSQSCWLRSWYNKMGFKNIAFLKMVFFNMWKLRTISLKNSVYFFYCSQLYWLCSWFMI